jgi:hypothetical protein
MNISNDDPSGPEAPVTASPADGAGRATASAAVPARRPTRLRAFLSELWADWNDPASPPPWPRLVDYPFRRRP